MNNNSILPEMKTGLNELKSGNKKQYDAIEKKADADANAIMTYRIMSFGYDPQKHIEMDEKAQADFKVVVQTLIQAKIESVKK